MCVVPWTDGRTDGPVGSTCGKSLHRKERRGGGGLRGKKRETSQSSSSFFLSSALPSILVSFVGPCKLSRRVVPSQPASYRTLLLLLVGRYMAALTPQGGEGGRKSDCPLLSSSSFLIQGLLLFFPGSNKRPSVPLAPLALFLLLLQPAPSLFPFFSLLPPSPCFSGEEETRRGRKKKEVGEISWEGGGEGGAGGAEGGRERKERAPSRPTLCKKFFEKEERRRKGKKVGD